MAPDAEVTRERFGWRRALIESSVIVGSILLAFTIDASWNALQERGEVDQSLEALREEFEGHRQHLSATIAQNQGILDGIAQALVLTDSQLAALPRDSITALANAQIYHNSFRPSSAALDALLSANVLEHITDLEVRQALLVWPRALQGADQQLPSVLTAADAAASRGLEIVPMDAAIVCQIDETRCSEETGSFGRLMADQRYRSLLAAKYLALNHYVLLLAGLEEPIETVLRLLDR